MNRLVIVILILVFLMQHSFANDSLNCITSHTSALGFKADLPDWDKSEMMRGNFHEFICANSKTVYIKIYKVKNIQTNMLHELTWNIREKDPNAHFIIKKSTSDGGIIVTTYRNQGTSIHRIRLINNNDEIFIIECSAPEKTFYKYEVYFNRVFQSFSVL
ncbi:MAG: hypothetical protein WBK20_09070 [Spirochaetota bacterium]